jgi:hypothetical protein
VDQYTGEVYLIKGNLIGVWNTPGTLPLTYQWRSKVFDLPSPVNFGALQVKFRNEAEETDQASIQQYADYNTARIAFPLNCVNLAAVNAVRVETIPTWTGPQNKTPTGGSPLYDLAALQSIIPAVVVRVWARDSNTVMQEVFSYTVMDEGVYRLPPDFMSDVWQFEIISNTDVYSFAIAETAKELGKV